MSNLCRWVDGFYLFIIFVIFFLKIDITTLPMLSPFLFLSLSFYKSLLLKRLLKSDCFGGFELIHIKNTDHGR